MTFDAQTIGRIIRGLIGAAMIIAGIIYGNWVGFLGVFLLIGAAGGGCGPAGCSVNRNRE
ncbi:MAG: hypothetical protein ACM34K_07420 [Bacillota bacterium]